MNKHLFTLFLATSLIASCGGGEDSPTSMPTSSGGGTTLASQPLVFDKTVEGGWQGSGPPNSVVFALVGSGGAFWLAYGAPIVVPKGTKAETTWSGFLSLDGFVQGSLTSATGVVSSTDLKDFTRTGLNYQLKLDGTYSAGSSFKATLASTEASSPVDTKPAPATSYIYGVIPRLSNLQGDWTGTELLGSSVANAKIATLSPVEEKATVEVALGSCIYRGEILPRISSIASENIFDVTLTSDAFCGPRSSTSFSGVAIAQKTALGKSEVLIMAVSRDRKLGFALLASR